MCAILTLFTKTELERVSLAQISIQRARHALTMETALLALQESSMLTKSNVSSLLPTAKLSAQQTIRSAHFVMQTDGGTEQPARLAAFLT